MAPPRKQYPETPCAHCGKPFEQRKFIKSGPRKGMSSGLKKQLYCSGHCRNMARSLAGTVTWLDQNGYPQMTINGKGKPVHRHVMEKMIGRPLRSEETVHHRDGDRTNYAESNLELWSSRHGRGQRISDHVEFAKETLRLYGEGPFDPHFIEQGRRDLLAVLSGTTAGV